MTLNNSNENFADDIQSAFWCVNLPCSLMTKVVEGSRSRCQLSTHHKQGGWWRSRDLAGDRRSISFSVSNVFLSAFLLFSFSGVRGARVDISTCGLHEWVLVSRLREIVWHFFLIDWLIGSYWVSVTWFCGFYLKLIP